MPDAEGNLTPEEGQEIEMLYAEVRAWMADAAERFSLNAAASAALLAGYHGLEDAFGTENAAATLADLATVAQAKADAGPSGEHRH